MIFQTYPYYLRQPLCLEVVIDDVYAYLLDQSVQSLQNNSKNWRESDSFNTYCIETKITQRVAKELQKISVDDLSKDNNTWFVLAVLTNVISTKLARNWQAFYFIDKREATQKYLSTISLFIAGDVTADTQYNKLVQEVVVEYYEATGDVQACVTDLICYGWHQFDTICRTIELQKCNHDQVEHYWIRLKHTSSIAGGILEEQRVKRIAMRHLYSLCPNIGRTTLEIFCEILEDEKLEMADIIQELVDNELHQAEDSVTANFVEVSLSYFHLLKQEQYIEFLKKIVERTVTEDKMESYMYSMIKMFKTKAIRHVCDEEYIFGKILARLKDGIVGQDYFSSYTFKKIVVYFDSFHLRDRLLQEYRHCLQSIFDEDFSLELVELGYTELITKDNITEYNFVETWSENLHGLEIVIDFCMKEKIRPGWMSSLYFEELEVKPDPPVRVHKKAKLLTSI
jgi:hypothetical protein